MKKLKLNVDSLKVDQFAPQDVKAITGTVAGQQLATTCGGGLCPYACESWETVVTGVPGMC